MADMTFTLSDEQKALKAAVYDLCKQYPAEYWRELDAKREYPEAFVSELTKAGYLAVLIPEEYGGGGLGIMEAALILEEIGRGGRQPGGLPRPDVHHGHGAAARHRGAEARVPAEDRGGRAAPAGLRGHRAQRGVGHHQAADHGGQEGRQATW